MYNLQLPMHQIYKCAWTGTDPGERSYAVEAWTHIYDWIVAPHKEFCTYLSREECVCQQTRS